MNNLAPSWKIYKSQSIKDLQGEENYQSSGKLFLYKIPKRCIIS